MQPPELTCRRCGRSGRAADAATGWSLDTPPRPTGSAGGPAPGPTTALCPDCARECVRDLEARLDP
ncbi:hypothetical protein D0Z06_09370 [Geodermatophilus marinus]|nr:hypothetical protein D0Z06_09370 [Geodermatophilus sp. LHW52908]